MIAKINGRIDFLKDSYVVVDVSGIGYKVFITLHTFGVIAGRQNIELYTHTYVREDTLALYGFLELDELEMFELLIGISGIGPSPVNPSFERKNRTYSLSSLSGSSPLANFAS